jgi:hypothetical protein
MKTSEEILERYLSEESADFYGSQRLALLCLLPFEMAKPYLTPAYVKEHEEGTLPEDEQWEGEKFDAKANILAFLPDIYKWINSPTTSIATLQEALLHLKALVWVVDEPFHDTLEPLYIGDPQDEGKIILDKISEHFGYVPTIQDTDFEEVPAGSTSPDEEA